MRQTFVFRLSMAHPGDLSALAALITEAHVRADEIVAVIGKTEGNGGVNDFTRGFFTQSLMGLLAPLLATTPRALAARLPCILSGGTEGVLSPHYVVLCRRDVDRASAAAVGDALAVGTAFSPPVAADEIGRHAHVESVAAAVRAAMRDADLGPDDVRFVQVKCPCVTAARAAAALHDGKVVLSADPNRSMLLARVAGAFGVARALGTWTGEPADADVLATTAFVSDRASISSGVEVECNEVVVLGHGRNWTGPLRIATRAMQDALDVGAVADVLATLGLAAAPQLAARERDKVQAVFVKCEPSRSGAIRGRRHTMLDDTDINAQRHIRGAVGGMVAAVLGDTRIFVSGGAEHQGPDGGGLVSIIAEVA